MFRNGIDLCLTKIPQNIILFLLLSVALSTLTNNDWLFFHRAVES